MKIRRQAPQEAQTGQTIEALGQDRHLKNRPNPLYPTYVIILKYRCIQYGVP